MLKINIRNYKLILIYGGILQCYLKKNNFIDDNIDISNIHLNKVILNVIDEYNQAIKSKNKIKCEDLHEVHPKSWTK